MIINKIDDPTLAAIQPTMCSASSQNEIITSLTTKILSIRDFKTTAQCTSCKSACSVPEKPEEEELITCSQCGVMFLIAEAKINNECNVQLKCNKQWFSAKTSVSTVLYHYSIQMLKNTLFPIFQ